MKKAMFGIGMIVVMMVALAAMVFAPGCTTTPTWDQGQANAIAQTLGAGTVTAFNLKGDKLKPQEKQAAAIAIATLGAMGSGGAIVPTQEAINKMIADKIKDPAEAAAAQGMAASFMAIIQPQLTDAVNKAGASAAGQVFLAFCKGLGSVPVVK